MPNHCLTVGLCAKDWKRLDIAGIDYVDFTALAGANLCEMVRPMPPQLQGIVSTTPKCRYRHKVTGKLSASCNRPIGDEALHWERVDLTPEEESELEVEFGAADWYGWQTKHWGTKWGTYETKVTHLGGDGGPIVISFVSAWCPPSPEMMRRIDNYLCQTYYLKSIRWIWHDPYGDSTHDIQLADE